MNVGRYSAFSGCGIVGAVAFQAPVSALFDAAAMRRMTDSLRHRGPTGRGLWTSNNCWLGHRRLALLDLAERGAQPMRRGSRVLSYNGEIYNYRALRTQLETHGHTFETDTDTEVLLAALLQWGESALDRLEGMFAFALWDERRRELLLARDPLGIKPLYYHWSARALTFASEVQALLAGPTVAPDVDPEFIARSVACGLYFAAHRHETLVDGVLQCPPGTLMRVDARGQLRSRRYWQVEVGAHAEESTTERVAQLRELVTRSVQRHLVADVPVASFLSGGLDSSIVTTVAARHTSKPIYCQTLGTPGDAAEVNEDARQAATLLQRLQPRPVHRFVAPDFQRVRIEDIDRICDVSCINDDYRSLAIARNFAQVQARGLRAVLVGQGADELMGGYWGRNAFHRILAEHDDANAGAPMDALRGLFGESLRKAQGALVPGVTARATEHLYALIDTLRPGAPGLRERSRGFLLTTVLRGILKLEDYLSMQASVEARVPFLDANLLRWLLSRPLAIHLDLQADRGKTLLARAFADELPASILQRPKQPLPPVGAEILFASLQRIYQENFRAIVSSPLVRRVYRLEALARLEVPRSTNQLWQLIVLWRTGVCMQRAAQVDPEPARAVSGM